MKEAAYYNKIGDNNIQCILCPHKCFIKNGDRGQCLVRLNRNGALWAENYSLLSAIRFDPIEKKPLYHFYPGYRILSVGSVGCNFSCGFCQNCDISQSRVEEYPGLIPFRPRALIELALSETQNIGIAYTYNEPVIYFEYVMETAELAKAAGLKNVMVTNGFIEPDPLDELLGYIDAFNIDLKSFRKEFYKKHTGGRLVPVLKNLETIRSKGKHLEITNLVIPDLNDNEEEFIEMIDWIGEHLGNDTVLHLSRYHPAYNYQMPATSESTLLKLYAIARNRLKFVYLGNIYTVKGNHTYCPDCGSILITRTGYNISINGMNNTPVCKSCHSDLSRYFIF